MRNGSSPALIFLAPAAAVAVVTWTDAPNTAALWKRLWNTFPPRALHEISARQAIPPLILALVFVPEVLASARAVNLDYSFSSRTARPITVTANKGLRFEVLSNEPTDYALSINRAIQAIEGLGANRDRIVNLDFMNPFPALLLGPAPKGVSVY